MGVEVLLLNGRPGPLMSPAQGAPSLQERVTGRAGTGRAHVVRGMILGPGQHTRARRVACAALLVSAYLTY